MLFTAMKAVFRIRDMLVRIRIRILLFSSVTLNKKIFFLKVFMPLPF